VAAVCGLGLLHGPWSTINIASTPNAATANTTTSGVPPRRSGRPVAERFSVIEHNQFCDPAGLKARPLPKVPPQQALVNPPQAGTNLALANLSDEAVTRRLPRRLSRIAKGRLIRCSKHAHARIAKGGGFLGEITLLCSIDQIS
jgi:hypothetical protein